MGPARFTGGQIIEVLKEQALGAPDDLPLDACLMRSTIAQQAIFDSDDLQEGARAFFERRPPAFSGR